MVSTEGAIGIAVIVTFAVVFYVSWYISYRLQQRWDKEDDEREEVEAQKAKEALAKNKAAIMSAFERLGNIRSAEDGITQTVSTKSPVVSDEPETESSESEEEEEEEKIEMEPEVSSESEKEMVVEVEPSAQVLPEVMTPPDEMV